MGARILLWLFGIPAVLILVLFFRLLMGPLQVPYLTDQAEQAVRGSLPADADLNLGPAALALDSWFRPVVKFAPVQFTDNATRATVVMDSLTVGFSPVLALFGQPGATVTLVHPQLQVVQDLFGQRLASFEVVNDPDGGPTVKILEGSQVFPSVRIGSDGLQVKGSLPPGSDGKGLRSDNEWLINTFESAEASLKNLISLAGQGKFSRLRIVDGELQLHDTVYGLLRDFSALSFEITPRPNDEPTRGRFSADLAGRTITGEFERSLDTTGAPTLSADVENLDFAALLPFLDDPDGLLAIRGAGRLESRVNYDGTGQKVLGGIFDVGLSSADLRIRDDYYPLSASDIHVNWRPDLSRFDFQDVKLAAAGSSATLGGSFVLGLDDVYGPTLGMSLRATDVSLNPGDVEGEGLPFDEITFAGWSAPLYGAVGIDRLVVSRPGVELRGKGRLDLLRSGAGIDMQIGGEGATADDIKRLWPYFLATEARQWFVDNVSSGKVRDANMKFDFPVGTLPMDNEDHHIPIPKGALSIDVVGTNLSFTPVPGMDPVPVDGETRLKVRDAKTSIGLDGGVLETGKGPVTLTAGAVLIDASNPSETVFELSGDVAGTIPAAVALTRQRAPGALAGSDLPLDVNALHGTVDGTVLATIVRQASGDVKSIDYATHGKISGFGSTEKISSRSIDEGELTFSVTPAGYHVAGTALLDGLPAELLVDGKMDEAPELHVASSINASEFSKFGFDVSQFLSGDVRFVGKPMEDGSLQLAVDLSQAELTIKDLGLSKPKGVQGKLTAAIMQKGKTTEVSQITLDFGTVSLKGDLVWDEDTGLKSAELTDFALSPGDSAQVMLKPTDTGYAINVSGNQLDLKPLLKRFFALDKSSTGGPTATAIDQTLTLDVSLKRALGFYRATAYNLEANLSLKGEDLQGISLQAQFAENNSVSITTNPARTGKVMTAAFNDLGTLLRFANVYPRLVGGSGSLVMTSNTENKTDVGQLRLRDFALVDEGNVAEVLGSHKDSKQLISQQNRLDFTRARASFVRTPDRIEVTDGIINGPSVGGTIRGFIYTSSRRYDLTGTYVPLVRAQQYLPEGAAAGTHSRRQGRRGPCRRYFRHSRRSRQPAVPRQPSLDSVAGRLPGPDGVPLA